MSSNKDALESMKEVLANAETDSHRYGNEETIEEVFDNPYNPRLYELEKALADTAHLTEKEAFAFVQGHVGGLPPISHDRSIDETAQRLGFESYAEYKTVKATAKEKIASAIWVYELIDAYRFPLPDECSDCGTEIEGAQFETKEDEAVALCSACADSETENTQIEEQRIAILNEVENLMRELEEGQWPHGFQLAVMDAYDLLLDDDAFERCVRSALTELEQAAERTEDDTTEIRGEITALREELPEKAVLSPQEEISG